MVEQTYSDKSRTDISKEPLFYKTFIKVTIKYLLVNPTVNKLTFLLVRKLSFRYSAFLVSI